jgi:hypothetical protein
MFIFNPVLLGKTRRGKMVLAYARLYHSTGNDGRMRESAVIIMLSGLSYKYRIIHFCGHMFQVSQPKRQSPDYVKQALDLS